MEDITKLSLDDIVRWIIANSDNKELMDKVNKLTFSFTSKYEKFVSKK